MADIPPLNRWLQSHAARAPRRILLSTTEKDWNAAALHAAAEGLAAWLSARGIGAGERIAWLGHNRAEQIILVFAAARLGSMVAPLNWRLAAAEQRAILEDAAPALLIADGSHAERAQEIAPQGCPVLICGGAQDAFAAAVEEGFALAPAQEAGRGASPLLLVYTSGTTGRPRGAVLSQRAVLFNALNAVHMHAMTEDDVILTTLPMFHVGGLNIQTLPALYLGARVILHETFDPAATLAAIAAQGPSLLLQVPATLSALMARREWEETDISCLRALAIGSTDVPLHLIEAVQARGVPVIQIYGSTETGPVAIYQRPDEAFATTGSIGRPGLHTQVMLADESGREVACGETGEILVRGPHVADGYWKGVEPQTFRDGWFRSGDMARMDEDGLFWFRGRRKHMIISGGENIYPAEIERALLAAGAAECAVVGIPDERWGERPAALVVASGKGAPDETALRAGLQSALARYKHPDRIVFSKALPRNAMGKVLLDEVRRIILSAG